MADLDNCPTCGKIYAKSQFRDVCPECWKEEEKCFQIVYDFMKKRENRAATIRQVVEQTGVEEGLVLKFVRAGRFKQTTFPNFGYPCDKCGAIIRKDKLCDNCKNQLRQELSTYVKEEERKEDLSKRDKNAYLTNRK